jgi:hypothetical protein
MLKKVVGGTRETYYTPNLTHQNWCGTITPKGAPMLTLHEYLILCANIQLLKDWKDDMDRFRFFDGDHVLARDSYAKLLNELLIFKKKTEDDAAKQ